MEKFLLLIREDLKKVEQMTDEQQAIDIQQMTSWVEKMAESGNFIQGDPLLTSGKYVSNKSILSDGPFIEAKEAISGYLIIEALDLNEAAFIAKSCPLIIEEKIMIEVRPILTLLNE